VDDHSELRISERPTLRRPVLIAAFRGWNDGGQAATLAAGTQVPVSFHLVREKDAWKLISYHLGSKD